jgi:hypothetical protein
LRRAFWIAGFKFTQAFAQSCSVKLADRKGSMAALCAAFAADQPITALARRFSQCGVNNLNQLAVGDGQGITHGSAYPQKLLL